MGILKKIFGICETRKPNDPGCWTYSNGILKIDLNRALELLKPNSSIRLEGEELPGRILVIRDKAGMFHAYKNKCTHMGRRIDPLPKTSELRCCSLMGSLFNAKGEIISGLGNGNLKRYEVITEGDMITIIIV
jgi:nitrite reductase/ring-hydroxylating ferredoxin subunit